MPLDLSGVDEVLSKEPPKTELDLGVVDDILKKKESTEVKTQEPSGNDSGTPTEKPKQPSLRSGEETKSFTEKIATNDLPQTYAKQQTKGKSDSEILAEKKKRHPAVVFAEAQKAAEAKKDTGEPKSFGDEIVEYAETVKTALVKGWKQGELASKINEVSSAQANAKMAKDFDFSPESYQKVYDQKVEQLGDMQKSIESVQSSKSVKKYEEARDNQEAWEAFKENPIDIITNLALSSAASLFSSTLNSKSDGGDPVVGNMLQAPAPTVPLLMAEKSYQLGMSSDVIGALQESGVDLKDPKSVKDAIGDDQKMAEIYSNARKRNIPIAIVDAVTGGIASKVTKAIPKKAVGVLAGLGVEATGGAVGEAAGQLNSGQKLDAKSILEEAAGEVGAGAPNVANSFINTEDGGVQVQEQTEQSSTNTEGAQRGDVVTQQQEPIVQPTSPEVDKGVVQITKVEERNVPEITQMTGNDVEALVQERLSPPKEDIVQQETTSEIITPEETVTIQEQSEITNEPTQEQDVPTGILDQSGTENIEAEKGTEQVDPASKDKQEKKSLLNRAYKGQTESQIKEAIAQYGLTYTVEGHAEAKAIADGIISDIGLENAIEAVNRFEVQGAPAAFILSKGIESLQDEILKTENTEQAQELVQEQAKLINSLDVMGRTGGRFSAALYDIYQNSDFNFDLERQIKQYKDANNGEIPKAVEDKMIHLDTELKEVTKKLKESEEKVRLLEEQAALEAIKADITKSVVKRQRKGKTLIAEGLDEIAEALGITLMAAGDKRASVVNGLAKIGRGMIEEGIATIETVSDKLREFVNKKLNGKLDFEEYNQDVLSAITAEPEVKSGNIKIKQSVIRKLVEEGANTIDELVDALRPIVKKEYPDATDREIRDGVTLYGRTVNPSRDEIDVKIGKMKRIGRLISALEDVRNKKRPLKSGLQREKMDADERALNKALREAMKELPMDLESQEKQLKTILDSTKQRLRNQIEDLNREIATKEQVPKSAKVFRSDEEIEELKKQRDQLKKEHDEVFKNDDYKDRLRLDIAKRNAEKKIADFERRIRERDLSVKKRTQVEADKELNKLKIKQIELKDEFVKLQYENELKNRTRRQKVIDGLFEAWGLTRALRATGEMSFILLQGGVQSIAHPVTAAKAFATAMSHFASETRSENWLRELRAKEQYMIMKESKLALSEPNAKLTVREEQFLGGWVNHIWDFGGYPLKIAGEKAYENWKKANPIKMIERAGVGYMNTLRVERFLQGEIMLLEQSKTIINAKEDYKNMADVINTLTGRGSIGALEGSAKVWSSIFFSPRNWASTIKTATPYALYHFGKMTTKDETGKTTISVAQKMAIRDFMTYVGATGAIVSLAAWSLNDDDDEETGVEFDPTSSDFMKIKLGNTRVDPWGGKIQQVILLSRIMTQSMKKADGKSYTLGQGSTSTSGELLAKMATNKLAPSASILNKYLFAEQKKVNGKYVKYIPFEGEFEATDQLANNLYPIYWDSIKETYEEQPAVLASFLSALAFMGMGVNTYAKEEKKKK